MRYLTRQKACLPYALVGLSLVSVLVACGRVQSETQQTKTAVTPLDNSCVNTAFNANNQNSPYNSYYWYYYQWNYGAPNSNTTHCNNQIFSQWYQYGFWPYPLNTTVVNGQFCGCGVSGVPVYMNNVGYGCLSNQSLYQVSFGGVYWFTLSPAPMQWVNIGQVSSTNVNVTHTGNGCTANVAAACYVGVANSCGPGLRCQPTAYGSPIGICVQ